MTDHLYLVKKREMFYKLKFQLNPKTISLYIAMISVTLPIELLADTTKKFFFIYITCWNI